MFVAGRKMSVGVVRGTWKRAEAGGEVIPRKDAALRGVGEEAVGVRAAQQRERQTEHKQRAGLHVGSSKDGSGIVS